ncbi:MAG: hypothetical protein PHN38_09705 [Sulfurospirillaceae bacterium]|nr:hypothetical protein [Sulfurospirillaceae bacterium]
MTNQFSNGYAAFVPQIWSAKLNASLDKSCVMIQCVNKNYEGEIKNAGDTVNIIVPGDVTVSTLTGDALSYSELAPSNKQLLIDQRKLFAFKINDVAAAQSNLDIMDSHLEKAKKAIETAQDSFLLGKHIDVPAANILGSTTAVSLTASNVYSQFVALAKLLKKSNAVSNDQKPWVVINPDIEAILLQSTQFTSGYQVADKTLREGSIGRIAGMDVLVSTNLAPTDGKVNVLAGTNDAITFASQLAKIESIRDTESFSDLVRGLYLYGAKTVVPNALAKMIVDASAL